MIYKYKSGNFTVCTVLKRLNSFTFHKSKLSTMSPVILLRPAENLLASAFKRSMSGISSLSETHKMLKKTCRDFADSELKPVAGIFDKNCCFPKEQVKKVGDLGLMAITYQKNMWIRGCPSIGGTISLNNTLFLSPILNFGNEEQKEKWILPFTNGEKIGCFSLSEPDNGSDSGAASTTASFKEEGSYSLNGTKAWVSNGYEAEAGIVFCATDKSLKHKGISCFIFPLPQTLVEFR
ncbi:Short-chain specific acyl-CoA dehydrogenase, mitochondrial [Armadillidium vulgare]|nr:Short-chain specific acyl-CoA dehydrogenase, mitochondrial [Armadillidium vulgare]